MNQWKPMCPEKNLNTSVCIPYIWALPRSGIFCSRGRPTGTRLLPKAHARLLSEAADCTGFEKTVLRVSGLRMPDGEPAGALSGLRGACKRVFGI